MFCLTETGQVCRLVSVCMGLESTCLPDSWVTGLASDAVCPHLRMVLSLPRNAPHEPGGSQASASFKPHELGCSQASASFKLHPTWLPKA